MVVPDTRDPEILRRLRAAIIDLVDEMKRARGDEQLIPEAGIPLDRALLALLTRIARHGSIGVVELADRMGRDHTTISRQMTKLQELELIERRVSSTDKRVRQAILSSKGRAMIAEFNAGCERVAHRSLASWTDGELDELGKMLSRLADDLKPAAVAKGTTE